MKQFTSLLEIATSGQGLFDITARVRQWTERQAVEVGILTVFCQHTSASLLIQENAAPTVRSDLERYFSHLAPEESGRYDHEDEGPDDMPAHIRTALTQVSLSIPLLAGRLGLGTWQGIFLFEHRRRPHSRSLVLYLMGE